MKSRKVFLIIGVAVILLAVILVVVIAKNKSTNNGISKEIENEIAEKWRATLPMNNTNDLEDVTYDYSRKKLYLKYKQGICIVDSSNTVSRYMQGDLKYDMAIYTINQAKKGEEADAIYIAVNEFEKIIKDI